MTDRVELPRAESCGTCRYWEEIPESLIEWDRSGCDVLGECRRFPPTTNGERRKNVMGERMALNAYHPVVGGDHWCGEWKPAATTPHAQVAYTTSVPFESLLDLISTRAQNCIEFEGTIRWEHLFASQEIHPNKCDQPNEYRNFGQKTYLEMLLAMAELGVKAPARWDIPKNVKSEFVKAGGEFFHGEYQPATVAPPTPAGG